MVSLHSESGMGWVVWITGLSGAGKSTLARSVCSELVCAGVRPVLLDGDQIRSALVKLIPIGEDHQPDTRRNLARTYSRLALLLASQGHTVVVATVSLFKEIHLWNRTNLSQYIEVFLDSQVEIVSQRSAMYSKESGTMFGPVVGVDIDAEFPCAPDFTFFNHSLSDVRMMTIQIMDRILAKS